jgi:hypothetical protein
MWAWQPGRLRRFTWRVLFWGWLVFGIAWAMLDLDPADPTCFPPVRTDAEAMACGYDDLEDVHDDVHDATNPPLFTHPWLLGVSAGCGAAASVMAWMPRRRLRHAGPPTGAPLPRSC